MRNGHNLLTYVMHCRIMRLSMKTIISKLKELRSSRGLTGEEVARLLGKSGNHVVSRIESGETNLSLETFEKLCKIYDVSPASLFGESKSFSKKKGFFDRVSYRAEEKEIAEELKARLLPVLKDLRKLGTLQEKLGRKPFNHKEILKLEMDNSLPLKSQKSIAKELARALREKLGIDEDDELDIVDLISNKLNIPVLGIDLGDSLWGFYSKDVYDFPLIVFNENNRFEGRKRFTLAHELGHYILHNERSELDFDGADKTDSEYVVDAFAQELLVPTDYLRRYYDEIGLSLVKEIKPFHVAMLASKFKVSFLMMSYTLKDMGKISWDDYKALKEYCFEKLDIEASDIGYDTSDYVVKVKSLSNRIKELSFEAKAKGVIGIDELSKLTNMSTQELLRVM